MLNEIGEVDLAKGLHGMIQKADRDSVSRFVLKTETSYPFLQEKIQKFEDPDFEVEIQREERRLEAAYNYFYAKTKKTLDEITLEKTVSPNELKAAKKAALTKLRDQVLFLRLIKVELENEDDAYLIFETLNTRGKDLALSDLLKNHFAKQIKGKQVDTVREQWVKIMENLSAAQEDIDPDIFFTHSWASRYEATTQQKAYKKIKEAVTTANAKDHLSRFVSDSEYYNYIFNPPVGKSREEKSAAASLQALRLFRVTQQTPAVLALVRATKSCLIKPSKLAKALAAIEDFHFLFTSVTSSRSSGGISAMYSSFGRRLFEVGNANDAGIVIGELLGKLVEKRPSYGEFLAGFEQLRFSNNYPKQGPLVKYALRRLSKNAGLAFTEDFSDLTVEHLAPQASAVWPDEDLGSIGNLILLTSQQNGQLKNEEFGKKVIQYRKWPETVPKDVLQKKDWTPQMVKTRTAELAQAAYEEVWTII